MTIHQIDQFIAGLSDEQFREHLAAALDRQRTPPGARKVIMAFKRPRDQRPLRALVFDMFGPKAPAPLPDFDAVPDLDL